MSSSLKKNGTIKSNTQSPILLNTSIISGPRNGEIIDETNEVTFNYI